MKQTFFLAALISGVLFGIYCVVNVYDNFMAVGRMHETPIVRPHEEPLLVMEKGVIPVEGSDARIRIKNDEDILPPQLSDLTTLEQGKKEYLAFCVHCHGNNLDGMGTVGQSFQPLPRDLTGPEVTALAEGTLFHITSYGQKRMPALETTLSQESRWAVIRYIRSKQGEK